MRPVNGWTFFYLMVVLKIPIVAMLGIVWWAIRKEPAAEGGGNSGGSPVGPTLPPAPPRPRPARRGPHAGPQPAPPARVRTPRPRERETA